MVLRHNALLLVATIASLMALLWVSAALAAPPGAPPTPHAIEGKSDCLMCHAPGTPFGVPADHEGRPNATCIACHPVELATPAEPTPAAGSPPPQPTSKDDACLACHNSPGLTFAFADGQDISAHVDAAIIAASVHGQRGIRCIDCHTDINGYPHPQRSYESAREYSLAMDASCQKCHSANYKKEQDSIHAQVLAEGDKTAPSCTDCHGAHDITPPSEPRQRISQTCASCHQSIYDEYADSVHGHALLEESNADVPVCTDCHGVHNIADARTAIFRLESPETCARCHADEEMMAKYGLSSRVYHNYKQEFHGITVDIYKTRYPTVWCYEAVCTDCHGVHDIRKTHDPESMVFEANLPTTCSSCHPGAGASFATAWTGHYEPSPENAPLVYYVNLFYRILIPLLMISLLAFIALDVMRRVLNRLQAGER